LFSAKAPDNTGDYEVTLTAHAAGYCDFSVKHWVVVLDCHGGRLKTTKSTLYPDCTATNDGGKISK
jgi:hypothetical protein